MSFLMYFVQILLLSYITSAVADERLTQPKKIQIRGHVGGATMGGGVHVVNTYYNYFEVANNETTLTARRQYSAKKGGKSVYDVVPPKDLRRSGINNPTSTCAVFAPVDRVGR